MSVIYLMRHGETLFDSLHRNQGQSDSPLTQKGVQQALLAKKWFERSNIHFDEVYSSPLLRAVDTARLMSGTDDIHYINGLKEIYLGEYEASPEYLTPEYPYDDFFVSYGGESLAEVTARMMEAMTTIASNASGKNVLVISHTIAIRRFLTEIGFFKEKEYMHMGNCSGAALQYLDNIFDVIQLIQAEHKAAGNE